MSNYNNLKTTIDANIKQNGNQEITGPILNSVLNQMVNILGTGYQFAGIATLDPATEPGTPDAKVFYIANGKGTYTNFGGIEVTEDEVVVLYWDSAWHKVSTGIASQAKLSELGKQVIYDITANNDGATFASLSALLSSENLSTLIPYAVRCGGMSIRFVQSSDNKYVQYRLMSVSFNTNIDNWQGIDDEPALKNIDENAYNILPLYGTNEIGYVGYIDWLWHTTNGETMFVSTDGYKGKRVRIVTNSTTNQNDPARIFYLQNTQHTNGQPLNTTSDSPTFIYEANKTIDIVVPQNCNALAIGGVSDIYVILEKNYQEKIYKKIDYSSYNGYISTLTNQWTENENFTTLIVNTEEYNGKFLKIISSSSASTNDPFRVFFLTSDTLINGQQPNMLPIEPYLSNYANKAFYIRIPDGCKYAAIGMCSSVMAELTDVNSVVTKSVASQGGKVYYVNGYIVVGETKADFFNGIGTINLIKFNAVTDSIVSIEKETSENVMIAFYDKNRNYIGYTYDYTTLANIPLDTEYIKVYKESQSVYTATDDIVITLSISHEWEEIKNDAPKNELVYFGFDVKLNNINEEPSVINQYNGDNNERHFDNGYIYLPKSYTPTGKPTRLIIFVHGTGQHPWATKVPPSGEYNMYDSLFKFLTYNGYAVADCCGITEKYAFSISGLQNYKGAPIGMTCNLAMYDFLMKNYNLCDDGCFIFGKSVGGICSLQLAYSQAIPVIAVGEMTPEVSMLSADMRYTENPSLEFELSQFGFTYTGWHVNEFTSDEKQLLLDNIERFIGYDPISISNDVDYHLLTEKMFQYGFRNVGQTDVWNIVNGAHMKQPFPLKIWESADDTATPYVYCQMYQKMARNGGSICYLRTMPNNTGGRDNHFCVDSSYAIQTNYATSENGSVTTTVAFAELVDWFNRWR